MKTDGTGRKILAPTSSEASSIKLQMLTITDGLEFGFLRASRIFLARMFSLFKREKGPAERTFKTRVKDFWIWYPEVSQRFYQTIEDKKSFDLVPEISMEVDKLVHRLAWVFGPGENNQGHSLTLTGEGNLHRQLLTQYWLSQAPKLAGWTFYAAKQPSSPKNWSIEMAGRKFGFNEFWVTPLVNKETETVDITVWHPLFETLPEGERWTVLFLFLDEVLGEYGTQQWIGEIKHDPATLSDSIPMKELNEFLKRLQTEQGWEKFPPGESSSTYHMKEQHSRFLRGDVIVGSTMHMRLINEYLNAEGELENPLRGTGADYVFVAFDAKVLPVGKEVPVSGEIEDALGHALNSAASGRLLGGALGTENAYVDLLLLDGLASVEIVMKVLRDRKLPFGTSINYFAKEKRGFRRFI